MTDIMGQAWRSLTRLERRLWEAVRSQPPTDREVRAVRELATIAATISSEMAIAPEVAVEMVIRIVRGCRTGEESPEV